MKNKIKQARKAKGLTQAALAGLARIGRSTISNTESGRYTPRVDVAMRIAAALQCCVEDIFMLD